MSSPPRIRPEQLEVLTRPALEDQRAWLQRDLRERHGDRDPAELDELLALAFTRCAQYGLRELAAIRGYVELLVERGPEFDRGPKQARSRQILADPRLPGPARIALVVARWEALRAQRGSG